MKVLKIEDNKGYFFHSENSSWNPIDQIDKNGLMRILNDYLSNEIQMDDYNESLLSNQAQQIIYKSIHEKLSSLNKHKNKFKDESERQYLDDITKYKHQIEVDDEL